MAGNYSGPLDEFGEAEDWIEIYNGNDFPVDLGGLFLSDSLADPKKFRIPSGAPDSTTIPAGGFMLFWADNSPEHGIYHLGFALSSEGEAISLAGENEDKPIDSLSYPELRRDRAMGRLTDGSDTIQLVSPSPGAPMV